MYTFKTYLPLADLKSFHFP